MNIKEEKKVIIELLNQTEEEWVIRAIKRLLAFDDDITDEEKSILDERLNLLEEGKIDYIKWNDVKDKL